MTEDIKSHLRQISIDMLSADSIGSLYALADKVAALTGHNAFRWAHLTPHRRGRIKDGRPQGLIDSVAKPPFDMADPVHIMALRSAEPFCWEDAKAGLKQSALHIFDIAAKFDVIDGFCVPVITGSSEKAFLHFWSNVEGTGKHAVDAFSADLTLIAYAFYHRSLVLDEGAIYDMALAEKISLREREALSWASRGLTNGMIARSMKISENTVKYYLKSACDKLNADNKTQAVALAIVHHAIYPIG